jgi:hypothetical protein
MHTTIFERLLFDAKENQHKHNKNAIDKVLNLSENEKRALMEALKKKEKEREER